MNKKLLISFPLLLVCAGCFGWGGVGHKAIAKIAENHLSREVLSKVKSYLGGKGMTDVASYPDTYRYEKTWFRDLGQEISNPEVLWPDKSQMEEKLAGVTRYEPWCHSYTVDQDFEPHDYLIKDGAYVRNCVMELDQIAKDLKTKGSSMSASLKQQYVALVIHIVGDMHCPMHTLYDPKAGTGGGFNVKFGTSTLVGLHSFWDTKVFSSSHSGWTYEDFAKEADTANAAQRRIIAAGTVYDWARESSRYCWLCQMYKGKQITSGKDLGANYATEMDYVLMHQLRDAGYRLAELLTWIFE